PMQGKAVVTQIAKGVPTIVIAPAVGTAAFGLMLWGQTVGSKLLFLFEPFRRVAFNHLCRTTQDAVRSRVYGRYLGLGVTSIGAWAILVDGLGESFLLALYGQKWAGGLTVATLAAVAATVSVAAQFASLLLDAMGRPAKGLGVVILRTALALSFAALVVPQIGILAGPIVWLVMSVFSTALLSVLASRSTLYQSCRSLLTYAVAVGLGLLLARVTSGAIGSSLLATLLATSVGLIAYTTIAYLLTPAEDRRWLTGNFARTFTSARKTLRRFRAAIRSTDAATNFSSGEVK
ncbi:MAG: hypothetical protein AAF266_01835, partial [Planctomycetota bacterium]